METKANYALIGTFTILGFLAMMGFVMWFAKLELNRQFAYYDVYFTDISGLAVSSQVQFSGLAVGRVVSTELAPQRSAVRVRLELREDTPVRTDSRASIDTSAVTGVSLVTITSGQPDSPLLRDVTETGVPVIEASPSTLQTLGRQAPELLERLNRLAEQLTQTLDDENQQRFAHILENVDNATSNLDRTMEDVSSATEAIGSLASQMSGFAETIDELGATADTTLKTITDAAGQADRMLARANSYIDDDLAPLTADLRALGQQAQTSIGKLDTALDTTTDTMSAAGDTIDEIAPVFTDLRETLGKVSASLANLPEELPQITSNISSAARSASDAFDTLDTLLGGASAPVQSFARDGLPQFSRLAQDLRSMVKSIEGLVSELRRNPAQLLRGQPQPEFRR